MMAHKVSVIIPTLNAGALLERLLRRLQEQTARPSDVVVVDSSSSDRTVEIASRAACTVEVIPRSSFNHGAARNLGVSLARGDVLVFMTQDACPADEHFLDRLTAPIRSGAAAGCYARQLPRRDASPLETFARWFNYPAVSHVRTAADIPEMGIQAFFFSNAAAAVDAAAFHAVGGFPEDVVMNEDMLLCAKLLRGGRRISYQADAVVYHSHAYSAGQQFRRYFDIGTFVSRSDAWLQGARAGGAGLRFVAGLMAYLVRRGAWFWIPAAALESAAKLVGFQLGKHERHLPRWLKPHLSMHRLYWESAGGR